MTYSGLLMCAFIFFFVFLIFEKRKSIRIQVGISLLIMMTAILFSQTRSVWVGIAFSITFFIIIINPKIILYIIPSILLLIIILPESVKDRVLSIFDPDNATNKDRVYMIYTGLNIFKDHPITGVGADNIKQVYKNYRHPNAKQDNPHLHNNFIQILAERGIFALFSLIVVFIFIFINLIQKIKNSLNFKKTIAYGSLFVFIGFLIAGLFEYNFGDTEVKFLLFFFLSIPFLPFYSKNQ
jgi:O-antigen ligase